MSSVRESDGPRLSLPGLHIAAQEMPAIAVTDIFAAGPGHLGESQSIVDVATALYFNWLNHDPDHPSWPDHDRVVWSAGHKASARYAVLGHSGYFSLDETVPLRQLGSKFANPNFVFHCVELRKIALPC